MEPISYYHSRPGSNGNQGVLAFPNAPGLVPHHQMQFSVIYWTLVQGVLLPCRDAADWVVEIISRIIQTYVLLE